MKNTDNRQSKGVGSTILMVFSILLLAAVIALTVWVFLRERKSEASGEQGKGTASTASPAVPGGSSAEPDWAKDEEEIDQLAKEMETATWQVSDEDATEQIGGEEDLGGGTDGE